MTVHGGGGHPDGGSKYHIYLYGKLSDPSFHRMRVAAEFLSKDLPNVSSTIESFFETQYEQHLRYIVSKYGSSFNQCRPSAPVIWAETNDAILFFLNEDRFMQWASKRFSYEDNTRLIFYKKIGNKSVVTAKERTGRSYCAISLQVGDEAKETLHIELFDEECPVLAKNFLDLLSKDKFNGHPVHRVKPGAWLQAGDLVDGSGLHSEAAAGGLLRDESFQVRHDRGGLVGMATHGKDSNGSQFYITLRELPFLDGRWVVIGRVIGGMRSALRVGKLPLKNERPIEEVKVYAEPEFTVGSLQNVPAKRK